MKKAKLAALSLCAVLLLSSCGSPAAKETNPPAPQEGAYVAGTYEASADGRNGPVKVSVTFTADAIEEVKIVEHAESNGISDPAISGIPESIVTYQSLGVDVVSGATITSEAILAAVAACVEQAGGDVEALKAVPAGEGEAETLQNATVDVLVVGGGGAGLSAALSAAQNGASVILVEKLPALGGNTYRCGGAFNTYDPEGQANNPMDEALASTVEGLLAHEDMSPEHAQLKADVQAQ